MLLLQEEELNNNRGEDRVRSMSGPWNFNSEHFGGQKMSCNGQGPKRSCGQQSETKQNKQDRHLRTTDGRMGDFSDENKDDRRRLRNGYSSSRFFSF